MTTEDRGTCGVCGTPLTDDFFEPPTYRLEPDEHGRMRPVLSKPIRMDPETGAVCWCDTTTTGVDR